MLSLDAERFAGRISQALQWLAAAVPKRPAGDRWCWTTAPLLSLLVDERLSGIEEWQQCVGQHRAVIEADLLQSFDTHLGSWVLGEEHEQRPRVTIDNALYVLYCLKDSPRSPAVTEQCSLAIEALIASVGAAGNGLPLFPGETADVGPTAHLVEVLQAFNPAYETSDLETFIATELESVRPIVNSFSWHLTGALAVSRLRHRNLLVG